LNGESERSDQQLEELIERAGKGDPKAIGILYELYQARLVGLARARLGNTLHGLTESIDLVQSVWKDLLNDLGGFEYRGPDSFYAWLRTRLERKIGSKRRHHAAAKRDSKRLQLLDLEAGIPARNPEATPTDAAVEDEEVRLLMGLLDRFPEPQREAMILRMRDGLSFSEIGRRIDRSPDAAKKLYERGIEKLIDLLPEDWRSEPD